MESALRVRYCTRESPATAASRWWGWSSPTLFSFSEHAHGLKIESTHSTHECFLHGFFITLPLGMKASNLRSRHLELTVSLKHEHPLITIFSPFLKCKKPLINSTLNRCKYCDLKLQRLTYFNIIYPVKHESGLTDGEEKV